MKVFSLLMAFIVITTISLSSRASDSLNSDKKTIGTLLFGAFNSPDTNKAGIELSAMFMFDDLYYFDHGMKFSVVLYEEYSDYNDEDAFAGYSFAWHVSHKSVLNPYFALGLFGGETFNCEYVSSVDYCEEDFIYSYYPELGLTYKTKSFQISPFVRRYFDFEGNNPPRNVYGISIGFTF